MTVTVIVSEDSSGTKSETYEAADSFHHDQKGTTLTVVKGRMPTISPVATYAPGKWVRAFVGETPKVTVTESDGPGIA